MKSLPASVLARLPAADRAAVKRAVSRASKDPGEDWEGKLRDSMRLWGLPAPHEQYRWHTPANGFPGLRQYRADFAYPHLRILLEVCGGIYKQDGGRHNRGAGFEMDRAKYNAAQIGGWVVLEFGPKAIQTGDALTTIEAALRAKGCQR